MAKKSEWRRLKLFEQENEKLRKEVSKLRKQVRSRFVDELQEKSDRVDKGQPAILPTCEMCGNHDISYIKLKRKDGEFEIRICRSCQHRSNLKKL